MSMWWLKNYERKDKIEAIERLGEKLRSTIIEEWSEIEIMKRTEKNSYLSEASIRMPPSKIGCLGIRDASLDEQ